MFGLGLWEIVAIVVVAVVFVKPDDWPKMLRSFGRLIRQMRSVSKSLQESMNEPDKREGQEKDRI